MLSKLVDRDGIELSVQCSESAGDRVLLVHGLGAEMLFWREEFCNLLHHNGFQVAKFDSRDSGDSTRLVAAGVPSPHRVRRGLEAAPYTLEDMADDVAAVLDALGWSSAHLVGHSMGAMIAQLFAVRHSARIETLTCISGSTSALVGKMKLPTLLRLLLANPAEFLGRPARGPEEAATRLIRGHRVIGSVRHGPDEAWLRTIAEARYVLGNDPGSRVRQEAAGWATGDIAAMARGIRAPTLVIHGEDDRFVRPEGGHAIAAAIPGTRLVVIPGMGHDMPRQLWPSIVDHIRANADRASTNG